MSKLYMDNALLIWNGNGTEGKDQIQNFWTELPISEHTPITLDAQPITGKIKILSYILIFVFFFFIHDSNISKNCFNFIYFRTYCG